MTVRSLETELLLSYLLLRKKHFICCSVKIDEVYHKGTGLMRQQFRNQQRPLLNSPNDSETDEHLSGRNGPTELYTYNTT